MDPRASRSSRSQGTQGDPLVATCDVCRHRHACYVGGAPRDASPEGGAVAWEVHVCLGCLMRAGTGDGWATCGDCVAPHSAA